MDGAGNNRRHHRLHHGLHNLVHFLGGQGVDSKADVPLALKGRLIEQKKSSDLITLQEKQNAALENLDRFVHRVSGTIGYNLSCFFAIFY
jgi:hypothetical protein